VTDRALLVVLLSIGGALRVGLLLGPFGEIDADEAIVGLMARQIPAELPAFYWGQVYLGSAEAFVAALLFSIFGPSAAALKLAPALFSVAFVWLTYCTARHAFGPGPALMTAAYLAVPPSFLAAWSVKARGGYAELLAFGALFLLASQHVADEDRRRACWAALGGLAGGLALWTHPLAVVYLLAGGLYVALCLARGRFHGCDAQPCEDACAVAAVDGRARHTFGARRAMQLVAVAGAMFLIGLSPALVHNVANGYPSVKFVSEGGTEPRAAILNLWGFVRYGLPVLVGLAEASPTRALLDTDWPSRPGSLWVVTVTLPMVGAAVVWWARGSVAGLLLGHGRARPRRGALFVLLLVAVVVSVLVTRFANLLAEPRYALPIYGAVPLFAAALWSLRLRWRRLGLATMVLVVVVNVGSLLTSNYRLSLPASGGETTAANRAELIRYLLDAGIDRIYTDYWLAYPIAFESGERIVPGIRSGGFSRRASYSHLVWIAENPAFVFARETPADFTFQYELGQAGGSADEASVSIYRVYTNVRPLEAMRVP